jgi:uncharacterized membrane protein YeaQ/YmgE (transglycosylase-associated protein family)
MDTPPLARRPAPQKASGNESWPGALLDIVLGIVGAVVGGWLFNTFGAAGVTGLNLYSLLVAVIGAVVLLVAYHAIRRVV